MKTLIRLVSIISYMSIILTGQMIGIPLILWLVFSIFDFGNIDQLFAIFGFIGIILNLSKLKNNIVVAILSFLLMLSPIVSRLVQVSIEMFEYLGFQIPLIIFILTYLTYILIIAKERILISKSNKN